MEIGFFAAGREARGRDVKYNIRVFLRLED